MKIEMNELLKGIMENEDEKKYDVQFNVNSREELINDMREFTGITTQDLEYEKELVEIINKLVNRDYVKGQKEYVFSSPNGKLYLLADAIKQEQEYQSKIFYHYTTKEGLDGIFKTLKIDNSNCWGNYVCKTQDDVEKFLALQIQNKFIDLNDVRVVEFTTNTPLEVSYDHNKDFIKADALVSYIPIEIEEIVNVFQYN